MAGIEDLFNRKVVGWAFGSRITKELTISEFEQAVKRNYSIEGLIFHSGRGSQYAAYDYQDALRKHGVGQSISGKVIAMAMHA